MSPTFTHGSRGRVYRYYVSAPLQAGTRRVPDDEAIRRVPANAVETLITRCIAALAPRLPSISELGMRVEIHPSTVQIVANCAAFFARPGDALSQRQSLIGRLPAGYRLVAEPDDLAVVRIIIPCRLKLRGGATVITDAAGRLVDGQPRPDVILIKALKKAHRLLAQAGGAAPAVPALAMLQASPFGPYERGMLRLAFLPPRRRD